MLFFNVINFKKLSFYYKNASSLKVKNFPNHKFGEIKIDCLIESSSNLGFVNLKILMRKYDFGRFFFFNP